MACNFLRRVSPSEIFSIALITWKQPAIGLAVALGALFLETNNPTVVGRLLTMTKLEMSLVYFTQRYLTIADKLSWIPFSTSLVMSS